jgi:hypothetical protein
MVMNSFIAAFWLAFLSILAAFWIMVLTIRDFLNNLEKPTEVPPAEVPQTSGQADATQQKQKEAA